MREEGRGKREERPTALCVVLLLLVCLALGVPGTKGYTQSGGETVGTPATEAVARDAMTRLRSPVTPSHTLDMCPAEAAEALRDTVRMAAAAGQSVNQIVEGVIARYGEHMRILPKRRGVGLWAWIAPPFVLLFGAGLLVAKLRSLRERDGAPSTSAEGDLSVEDRARLEAALDELEQSQEEPV